VPEGLEAEIWRNALDAVIGRRVERVWVDERVAPPDLAVVVVGSVVREVRRLGKVVLIDTTEATIGLHFGMTGRVEVDGSAPIGRLEYSSGADRPEWDRLRIATTPGVDGTPAIRMNDPRRLGRVSLDPDLSHLGPDMFGLSADVLGHQLERRGIAVKSALLDQAVVAGLGNMCADEVLWWSGLDPRRPANSLMRTEVVGLAAAIRRRLPMMLRRGGSHTGVLDPAVRASCPPCERDGGALQRATIGGRTAVWCPRHQR
jgi:formamidopyrimidine-DNA glycosylase